MKQAVDSIGQQLFIDDKVYVKQAGYHREGSGVFSISKITDSGAKYISVVNALASWQVQKLTENNLFIKSMEQKDEFGYELFEYYEKITTTCIKIFNQN